MVVPRKDMIKFYMSEPDLGVRSMLLKKGHALVASPTEADIVVFPGGEDINPFLYGEPLIEGTYVNHKRDLKEISLYKSLPHEIGKVGICRGGQLINVLCGGKMWQHVSGHAGTQHALKILGGATETIITVNSVHHQQMIPGPLAEVRGISRAAGEKISARGKKLYPLAERKEWTDVEVIHYWHENAVCFQPHPEYDNSPLEATDFFWRMVDAVKPKTVGKQSNERVST